jgi:hypothetical protein
MSLGKRHIGRRVAGVGVAVALMVLGLEAPAFAVTGVTSFTPSSGPNGCVLDITGTDFDFPEAQTSVGFRLPGTTGTTGFLAASQFTVVSGTEIWAEVPATGLTASTSYQIEVTNPGGTADSTGLFTYTGATAAGTCTPTIDSFTPTCGLVGTQVTVTGTNLLQSGTTAIAPAEYRFSPYTATEVATILPGATSTSATVVVPNSAATGRIQVDNGPITGFSATPFTVVTALTDCPTGEVTTHARSISFKIKKSGKASGVVSSTEDPAFTDCVAAVPVKIQRKKNGAWKTVGKTTTTATGSYTKKVKNPKGKQKFRALAPKVSLGDPVTDVCTKAKSAVRKI